MTIPSTSSDECIESRLDNLADSAVVIRSVPRRTDRENLAARIGADEVIVLALEADQAKARATADARPTWTPDAIDRWWDRYEPSPIDSTLRWRGDTYRKESVAMADDPTPDDSATEKPEPDKPDLGDAGKKALDEERKARRDAERQLREMNEQLKQLQDKDKSESERLTEKLAQLEKDLASATAKADRFEVALEQGLDMTRAKRLTGSTREELEADAEELKGWTAGNEPGPTPNKPVEDLAGGGDPTSDPEPDIRQVVESIPRGI